MQIYLSVLCESKQITLVFTTITIPSAVTVISGGIKSVHYCRGMVLVLTALRRLVGYLADNGRRPSVLARSLSRVGMVGPDETVEDRTASISRQHEVRGRRMGVVHELSSGEARSRDGRCKQHHDEMDPDDGVDGTRIRRPDYHGFFPGRESRAIHSGGGRLSSLRRLANLCNHVVTGGAREAGLLTPLATLSGYIFSGLEPRGEKYPQGIAPRLILSTRVEDRCYWFLCWR